MNVSIIGATGYGGSELIRILKQHSEFNIHSIHSSSKEAFSILAEYPHLQEYNSLVIEPLNLTEVAQNTDIVFLAAPSGISSKIAPSLIEAGVKVIDLAGDFRLKDETLYEKWYHFQPPASELLHDAVYGLAEWNKKDIKHSSFIANPGCYPTASLLGLAPLVKENLIDGNSIIIDAKSGVSGAGKAPSKQLLYSEVNENLKIYKVNQHQHIPEIEQQLQIWNEEVSPITFSTHLVPMTRGIMATIYGTLSKSTTIENLIDLYKQMYENTPFVRIREMGHFPSTKEVFASNYCDIGLTIDERTGRVTVVSVIDNLGKGAAGQAIQNANIMFGLDESKGLSGYPLYP